MGVLQLRKCAERESRGAEGGGEVSRDRDKSRRETPANVDPPCQQQTRPWHRLQTAHHGPPTNCPLPLRASRPLPVSNTPPLPHPDPPPSFLSRRGPRSTQEPPQAAAVTTNPCLVALTHAEKRETPAPPTAFRQRGVTLPTLDARARTHTHTHTNTQSSLSVFFSPPSPVCLAHKHTCTHALTHPLDHASIHHQPSDQPASVCRRVLYPVRFERENTCSLLDKHLSVSDPVFGSASLCVCACVRVK